MNLIDYTCYDGQDENYVIMKGGYGWNKRYLFGDGDSRYIYYRGDGIQYFRYDISLIFQL